MSHHAFKLDAQQLKDGLVSGNAQQLRQRLDGGSPITILAVGASVTVQGGCLNQEGAECTRYSGEVPIDLGWGRSGLFKGFLIRWFEWINSTWPHPGHMLINRASGGTALQTIMPCLFGTLPHRLDVVVLEVGSMAKFLSPTAIELATRRFRSLPIPAHVLFVTVPMWYRREFLERQDATTREACQSRFAQNDFSMPGLVAHRQATRTPTLHLPRATPWSRTEAEVNRVCAHYDVSCLSVYRALAPAVRSGRAGFSMAEVARDCIHPMHGTFGTDYVTDLLVHWLAPHGRLAASPTEPTSAQEPRHARLPRPLAGRALLRAMHATTACYFLHADGTRQQAAGDTTWLVAPWRSADCGEAYGDDGHPGAAPASPRSTARPTDASAIRDRNLARDDPAALSRSCRVLSRQLCPAVKSYQATLAAWRGTYPRGWIYCKQTISPKPRQMKNLAAFTAGALAYVTMHMPPFLAAADSAAPVPAVAKLLHLVSYEHMGVARVTCVAGCTCEGLDIDAHRVDRTGRNVSVYVEQTLPIVFAPRQLSSRYGATAAHGGAAARGRRRRCVLALRVLRGTSSGEHRWVLTRLTVSSTARSSGDS